MTALPPGAERQIYAADRLDPPSAIAIAANSITLEAGQGYMYKMDDGEWTEKPERNRDHYRRRRKPHGNNDS